VKQDEKGIFFRGVEFRRTNEHGLDFGAFGAVKPKSLGRIHFERSKNGIVVMREPARVCAVAACCENFRRHC
jgi:hypothetical protein